MELKHLPAWKWTAALLALPLLAGGLVSDALAKGATAAPDRVARGKFLVGVGGCTDCHTPLKMGKEGPEPDLSRYLAGHPEQLTLPPAPQLPPGPWMATVAATMTAWSGPWGTTFTANLTPDPETGLGRWTERNFIDTVRNGRHLGQGRPILPPMPLPALQALGDEDLGAIFAFLHSLPAVKNRVPAPLPPPAPVAAATR